VLFYATPVIYLPDSLGPDGRLRKFIDCSPIASYLDLVRRPILHGEWPGGLPLLLALSLTSLLCIGAVICLRKSEQRLILWL
jgi:lipopolysaccharide transport system permease protein